MPDRHQSIRPAKVTQVSRLVAYLRTHPQATGADIFQDLAIPKYTSRVSDARDQGYNVACVTRADGLDGYVLVEEEPEVQVALFFAEAS